MATYGQLIEIPAHFSSGNLCTLKVYHYVAGTTTLKDVYTDREKTTTAAQPVVSDSNGVVSFYADGLYKFRIDGATDGVSYTTLYTYDKWAVVDQSQTLTGEGTAIASAGTLTLGTDGNIFHVTGSTGPITSISGNQTTVTLVFDSTPTLTHSASLILQYAVDYVTAANNTMTFFNEGSGVWRELSRTPAFVDMAAAGDIPIGSGNDTTSKLTVGAAGTIPMSRAAATNKLAYVAALNWAIYGLTYTNGTDATNDFNISAGGCMDATGAYWMTLSTALGKQLDTAWAVGGTTGTPLGGLDTGAVGNNGYYIWLIARSDTGVVDALYSLSATAPTMPTNYDFKRLIGYVLRAGASNYLLTTYELSGGGIKQLWTSPTLDINLATTLTTSRRTDAVKVPLFFTVEAILNVIVNDDTETQAVWVYCPDQADLAPSVSVAPLSNARLVLASTPSGTQMEVQTSSTGTIAARATNATVNTYAVSTIGFKWARRN